MTLQQIECFLKVADSGNFHQAAQQLYLSQPTLSRQISSLESELGVLLFSREKKSITLTDVGKSLYPYFEKLYQSHTTIEKQIHSVIDSYSKHLVIGLQENQVFDDRMDNVLQKYREGNPKDQIFIRSLDVKADHDALLDRSVDCLVYLSTTLPNSPWMDSFALYDDQMCLAIPASHPNAKIPSISYEEIKTKFGDLPLRMINISSFETPLHNELQGLLDDFGADRPYFLTGSEASITTFYLSVEHGLCSAIVNSRCLLSKNDKVRMIPITHLKSGTRHFADCTLRLGWNRSNHNPSLKRYLALMREEFADTAEEDEEKRKGPES